MEAWLVILITVIFSAFFSGMEIAFITSNKLKIELENKKGSIPARIFSYFSKHPSRYLGTMLMGNNIALVVFGIYMEKALSDSMHIVTDNAVMILLIQTLISTMVILLFGEFIPKNLFRIYANNTLNIFAIPVVVVYAILYPIIFFTIETSEYLLKKVFKVELSNDHLTFGRIDLDNYLSEAITSSGHKNNVEHEVKIFKNALDFNEVKARECMVPRTEIVGVDVNSSIEELRKKFVETRLSKILVYEGNVDNMIGYVHSFELFKSPQNVRSILLPVAIIPESMPASDVLTVFIQNRKSIGLVVDEYGGTAGIITMEDVIEEIFGEIEDEHDKEELVEKNLGNGEFLFSARLEVDYLNEKFKLNLPHTENFETLAGLMIHHKESIPEQDDEVKVPPYLLKASVVKNNKVELILVSRLKEDA